MKQHLLSTEEHIHKSVCYAFCFIHPMKMHILLIKINLIDEKYAQARAHLRSLNSIATIFVFICQIGFDILIDVPRFV